MKSWKALLADKRLLLVFAIILFALLASWCESRMRRGEQPRPAQNNGQLAAERRREQGEPPRQMREMPEEFEGATAAVEQLKPDPAPAGPVTLRKIRTGDHDDFDRVVFDFDGDTPPGFRVEYVDKLTRKCGSDELKVLGGTWLLVRMTPAQSRDESGRTSFRGIELNEDLTVVKFIRPVCDAGGQLEWIIEVADRKPYRAAMLREPAQLVIDIKHEPRANREDNE
jgi:hypothetical protein